jgi:hypothetical protein
MEIRGLTQRFRPLPSFLPLLSGFLVTGLAGVLALGAPAPVQAELVVLTDGSVLKAKDYDLAEGAEKAQITLARGGSMTLPIGRIERVVDDEVDEPPPVAAAVQAAVVPTVPPPINLRFEEGQKVPEGPYGDLIYETARRHEVNPQIVAALIRQESAFNSRAVSRKGARGLMQLMPATAQRFGVSKERLFEPKHNLDAGVRYLRWLVDQFPDDLSKVLAAYNAGEGNVARYQGIPPFRETRDYVRRIFTTLGLTVSKI